MTIYRIVAYHNEDLHRESLDFFRSLDAAKAMARTVDPVKYQNYYLAIEDDGEVVATFTLKDGKFTEVVKDKS